MKTKPIFIALLISFCLFYSGCFYLFIGAVGAVGGYAVSDDAIQGDTDRGIDKVWSSALRVTNIMGAVDTEDRQKGTIEATVDVSKVKVSIEQLTPKTVRMRVSARRHLLPNRKLAQKIYLKIIENAK
ncbi:MAG: hypothetical protein PHY56_08060 [Candidatus Omnitrophica bacterium]|nr:hypothetical protein [Candidatus Omnitrophota bacterium]